MSECKGYKKINLNIGDNYVAVIEIRNPPLNFFDVEMISEIGDALEGLDNNPQCRAVVLGAEGKVFCAGANFGDGSNADNALGSHPDEKNDATANPFKNNAKSLYGQALRLFKTRKPIVGAIHGAAVGGGLGLALVPDFRVSCEEARFSANFSQLGIHPGFGLTHTLPRIIGQQNANLLFYTGKRISGSQAYEMGLVDLIVGQNEVRDAAIHMAEEIASAAPLAVESIRESSRQGLADGVYKATQRELQEQVWLMGTADALEGMKAVNERRKGNFQGK